MADAEVAAGHDQRVFFFAEANQTFLFPVVVLDHAGRLAFSGFTFCFHAVNTLELEGQSVDKRHLLEDARACDCLVAVLGEDSVAYHRVLLPEIGVVDRDD